MSEKPLEGMALWCAVYDGPICWEGRDAFEQIQYLQAEVERLKLDVEIHEAAAFGTFDEYLKLKARRQALGP